MKVKAAVAFRAGEPLRIETVDLQGPKDNEVLVELKATGVCHTDAYTLSGADPEGLFPCILGHEGAGVVVEVGKAVTTLKKGDHVIPLYTPECRQCKFCLSRKTNLCQLIRGTQERYGSPLTLPLERKRRRHDLAVEAGTQRGCGAGAARYLPVHRVEEQRDDAQGDQRRAGHRPDERGGDQARDPGAQHRPGQSDPVRREYRRLVAPHAGGGNQRRCRPTGSQPGDPASDAESSRGGYDAK